MRLPWIFCLDLNFCGDLSLFHEISTQEALHSRHAAASAFKFWALMARVIIENLGKVFTVPKGGEIQAVQNLSLTVEDKDLMVVVGPSGCGKTTTLRLIAGLEEPSSGNISLDGENQQTVPPDQRDIAMVFQNPALFPQLNVYENIALGLKLRKVPTAEIRQRVTETAEMLGLTGSLQRRPHELSGGQQQRVALGRGIVRRPRLFLLDEPLSSLDAPLRAQMRAEIAQLQRQLGITMILVTHDQTDAMILGHRIAVLREGQLQQVASPAEIYAAPVNQFVAGFIGFPPMNFLKGTVQELGQGLGFRLEKAAMETKGPLIIEKKHLAALGAHLNRTLILGVRPEHIRFASTFGAQEVTFPAGVEWLEELGAETILHLRAHEAQIRMRVFDLNTDAKRIGETVSLSIPMERVSYFDPETGVAIS